MGCLCGKITTFTTFFDFLKQQKISNVFLNQNFSYEKQRKIADKFLGFFSDQKFNLKNKGKLLL